jgi:hypothetical protein
MMLAMPISYRRGVVFCCSFVLAQQEAQGAWGILVPRPPVCVGWCGVLWCGVQMRLRSSPDIELPLIRDPFMMHIRSESGE